MKKWKYYTQPNLPTIGPDHLDEELNELGADGWELVCVVPDPIRGEPLSSAKWMWVFKHEEQ